MPPVREAQMLQAAKIIERIEGRFGLMCRVHIEGGQTLRLYLGALPIVTMRWEWGIDGWTYVECEVCGPLRIDFAGVEAAEAARKEV